MALSGMTHRVGELSQARVMLGFWSGLSSLIVFMDDGERGGADKI
jgi:hypothetical protein